MQKETAPANSYRIKSSDAVESALPLLGQLNSITSVLSG